MYFSHFSARVSRRLVEAAGLVVEQADIVVEPEDRHGARFLWVVARAPRPSMSADWEPGHRRPFGDDDQSGSGSDRDGRAPGSSSGDGAGVPDAGRIAWLVVGAIAIAAGTALGWDADALSAVVTPPLPIRAALVGLAVAIGMVLLLGALNRLAGESDEEIGPNGQAGPSRDISTMIRGVRFVFLAVAAFAAASGWLLGHPLPLVVALVIAGVDVLETSFLLIVVGLRRPR